MNLHAIRNIVRMERYAYTGDGKYPAPKRSTATETYAPAHRQPEIGKHTKNRKRWGKKPIRGTEKIPTY
jgi:hypothetical protein